MKKLTTLALAALVSTSAVFAENKDNFTSSDNSEYTFEYWSDVKDNGEIWPNWKVTFTPELDAVPANVAFNYVLKTTTGDVVKSGAAASSGTSTTQSTGYTGPWTDLAEGSYQMLTTVTFIKAGTTDPIITNFECPLVVSEKEAALYNFEFHHTEDVTDNSITINYEFVETDNKEIPEGAIFNVELGIAGFPNIANDDKTAKSGSITFTGLNAQTNYTVWTNNPKVTIDDKNYVAKANNFDVKTTGEALYSFEFRHTEVATPTSVTINYEFVEKDGKEIPEDAVYAVRLGIAGPGDKSADTKSGSITYDGLSPETNYLVYTNNPSVTINGVKYDTNAENFNVTTSADPNVPQANLTYTITDATATTKARLDYRIELVNIEEEGTTARVWLDVPGNITIGESNTLSGSIEVDVEGEVLAAWLKGQVTYTDATGTPKTINTNPNDIGIEFRKDAFIAHISIAAGTPVAQTSTTGWVPFTITTDNETADITYSVWCVTNGEVAVSDVFQTQELTGNLPLYNLNENQVTELWLKVKGVDADGNETNTAQYPGEAEGFTGLSINTLYTSVNEIEVATPDSDAIYFNLQGVQVENPANGLFICVKGNKAQKVIIK